MKCGIRSRADGGRRSRVPCAPWHTSGGLRRCRSRWCRSAVRRCRGRRGRFSCRRRPSRPGRGSRSSGSRRTGGLCRGGRLHAGRRRCCRSNHSPSHGVFVSSAHAIGFPDEGVGCGDGSFDGKGALRGAMALPLRRRMAVRPALKWYAGVWDGALYCCCCWQAVKRKARQAKTVHWKIVRANMRF